MINNLIKRFLKKNQVLRNNHLHKSCYIIGNGSSLKYIDLGMLCDLPSLTTGLNYLHNDFKKLNVVADFHLHPGIFSPIWRHPYTKK